MDLPNILNTKGPAAKVEHTQQKHHLAESTNNNNNRPSSETGSERGVSPHMSDHSSKYLSRPEPILGLSNMTSAPHLSEPPPLSYPLIPYPTPTNETSDGTPLKAFACGTCGKGFARRSDLARHGMSRWWDGERFSR